VSWPLRRPVDLVRSRLDPSNAVGTLIVLSAVLVLAVGYFLTSTSAGQAGSQTTSAPADVMTRAQTWVMANLSPDDRFVTDQQFGSTLRAQWGRATIHAADGPLALGPHDVDYLLLTPALRSLDGPASPVIAQLVAASTDIADFGAAAETVEIRQVTTMSQKQQDRQRDTRGHSQLLAARRLLANPRLNVQGVPRAVLESGAVDIRAAAALAVALDSARITLLDLPVDSSERAAGMPARTLHFASSAPKRTAGAIQGLAKTLAPRTNQRLSDGSVMLRWSPDAYPATTLPS
jgi:hypothetical protein